MIRFMELIDQTDLRSLPAGATANTVPGNCHGAPLTQVFRGGVSPNSGDPGSCRETLS